MSRASDVVAALSGKTLSTAESLTGGGIGSAITGVSGSSLVYKGGIVSYVDEIKARVLGVEDTVLRDAGAVSAPVAEQMAAGVRQLFGTDYAVSATGLAGPGGDEYGNPVGLVFIGYADEKQCISRQFLFSGDREAVRRQSVDAAFLLLLEML